MGRFNGNNNQSALRQFIERTNFSVDAYPSDNGEPYARPIKDFNFAERTLYGRIDKLHNPIQLIGTALEPIGEYRAVNFVVDAFEDFLTKWQSLATVGKLDESDPMLYEIEPQRAYVDYEQLYANYKISLREAFLQIYLTKERSEAIIDFNSFLKPFFDFLLDLSKTMPITRSAYIPSRYVTPLISGLCIEIGSFDASDDSVKEMFIDSPNFEYYKLTARSRGFSIDKQAPWRLIADIASPQMLRFASRWGQNTEQEILNNFYSRVGATDITELVEIASDTYNELVRRAPVIRTPLSLGCIGSTLQRRYIDRPFLTPAEIRDLYPFEFWLDTYIDIRYNEQKEPISSGALTEMRKVCRDLLQNTTQVYCLTYINNNIKGFDNFRGSYVSRALDRSNADNNTNIQPTH
jgi:hypothetical protein